MYDLSYPISPNKALTKEGFLVCRNAVIASIGTREYLPDELDQVKPNADGKVFLIRPSDVLFSDDTINSFEGKPVTLGHPDVANVNGENWKQFAVGTVSHVRQGRESTAGCLVADIIIFDPKAIEEVVNGKAIELSCGFDSNVIDRGGGIGVETNFIGNHVALVPLGRGGRTCSLKDSAITKSRNKKMAFFNKKDEAPDVSAQILQQLQALTERVAAIEKSTQAQSPAPSTNADEAKQPETNEAQTQTPAPENKAVETPAPATEEKKADDDMNVAPNPLAGIDPAVLGVAILQALTDAKADKKADEKADKCKKEEAKKDAKPEIKLDAAMIRDAADIAPSLAPTTPNLPYAAILEFAKSTQGKSFVDSFGDLSKCDHAMVLRACANFKRSMTQATLATVKHDEAPKKAKSFVEQSAALWNKAR
jgi:hypothetical protein